MQGADLMLVLQIPVDQVIDAAAAKPCNLRYLSDAMTFSHEQHSLNATKDSRFDSLQGGLRQSAAIPGIKLKGC
jgi:hypothetical protein